MAGLFNAKSEIVKNFEFLGDYGFKGPFEWNLAYEQEYTYVNGKFYLNIGFDGGFIISVGVTKKPIPELSDGQLTLKNVKYEDRKSMNPFDLLSKEEKLEYMCIKKTEDELPFWTKIIKKNPEILHGDWHKFTIMYKIKKIFGHYF